MLLKILPYSNNDFEFFIKSLTEDHVKLQLFSYYDQEIERVKSLWMIEKSLKQH